MEPEVMEPTERLGIEVDRAVQKAKAQLAPGVVGASQLDVLIEGLREALVAARRLGDRNRQVDVLELLCKAYQRASSQRRGGEDLALAYGEEAVQLLEAAADPYRAAVNLMRLAAIRQDLGQLRRTVELLSRAVEHSRAAESPKLQILAATRLAGAHQRLGELDLALQSFEQALLLLDDLEDGEAVEADLRFGFGSLLIALQSLLEAQQQFERAAQLYRQEDPGGQQLASVLNRLAHVAYRLGDRQRLESLLAETRALLGAQGEASAETQRELALTHVFAARFEVDAGNLERAASSMQLALDLARSSGDRKIEGMALLDLGRILRRQGDAEASLEHGQQALKIFQDLEEQASQALAGIRTAEALFDLGRPQEAWPYIEPGLSSAERQRIASPRADIRADYFAFRQDFFEIAIDVLMAKHFSDDSGGFHLAALEAHERRRTRNLLDALAANTAQGPDEDPQLLAEERALEADLRRLTRGTEAQVSDEQVMRLVEGLRRVRGELSRRRNPEASSVAPVDLSSMLSALRTDDSLVLVYSLSERRGYVWSILEGRVEAHPLQELTKIQGYSDHLAKYLTHTGERSLAANRRAAKALGEALLGPVAHRLADRRLVIVAPGALQRIPFAALMRPGSTGDDDYLIREHEVVMLPSIASLVLLRQQEARRPPPERGIFALADPVFGPDDPRLQTTMGGAPSPSDPPSGGEKRGALEAQRRAIDFLAGRLEYEVQSRLPGTGQEVAALISLAEEADVEVVPHVSFGANREALVETDLGGFRVLHIASHAFQDQGLPELSGLILSMVDEHGQPRNGFVRAFEISRLRLPVELVVLSACETGRGKRKPGEGVLGLSRAFLDAGASRLITSLWKVDDGSTAELMRHFYDAYLRTGLSPSAALRHAQLVLLDDPSTQAPYHWAGFVFQGEWRPAPKDPSE